MGSTRGHHLDALARGQTSVDHADVGDHASIGVVDGVEDHGAGRGIGIADGRRDLLDQAIEQFLDPHTGLARNPQHVLRLAADERCQLLGVLVGIGRRQIDLVQHGDDVQIVLERQIEVRERLGLDALGGVDEQDRSLARGERT